MVVIKPENSAVLTSFVPLDPQLWRISLVIDNRGKKGLLRSPHFSVGINRLSLTSEVYCSALFITWHGIRGVGFRLINDLCVEFDYTM